VIVSAGSAWYIDRVLQTAGVQATVHSNPGRIVSGKGLVLDLATDTPFFCPNVGVDKSEVVRDALARYNDVAFAGDGPPDVAPSLLVDPRRRFAKGFLAEELRRRDQDFTLFSAWHEIQETLLAEAR
jgi:2-hydroxy-3-keto-5-methylthiopentenyl-1-phosphate phosphatase